MIAVVFFGVFFAGLVVMVGAAVYQAVSPSYRRKEARHYADWLEAAYPDHTAKTAADLRLRELMSKSYYRSEKNEEEARLVRLVVGGWHLE